MKHKTLRTLLCVILTVCFCLSAIVPASAAGLFGGDIGAASIFDEWFRSPKDPKDLKDRIIEKNPGTDETPAEPMAGTGEEFIRIFHLDCGRRYFSVEEINGIIDELAVKHYTHIELAFGNDGFRFLLDDTDANGNPITITANGTTYKLRDVNTAIHSGNVTYSNGCSYTPDDKHELTQSDMDEIITHANDRGIGIIPLMDIPGHSNALIDAMNHSSINLNVTSHTTGENIYKVAMRAFEITDTKAVSFVTALAEKYIDYFASKKCKYFNLGADECGYTLHNNYIYGQDEYLALANMLNTIGNYIVGKSMTPMIFNDGFRQTNGTDYLKTNLSEKFVVCYWTESGYTKAAELATKFKIVNTHNGWYYVIGNDNGSWASYNTAKNGVKNIKCTSCDSGYTTNYGCMFAVWCDDPSKTPDYENRIYPLIQALANNNPDYFKAPVTPVAPTITASKTSLALGDTATLSISTGANATWTSSNTEVLEVAATTRAVENTSSVIVTAVGVGTAAVSATLDNGTVFTSDTITVSATRGDTQTEKTITVTVGNTVTETVSGEYNDYPQENPYSDGYSTITTSVSDVAAGVEYVLVDSLSAGTFYISNKKNADAPTLSITLEDAGDGGYYLKNASNQYCYPKAEFDYYNNRYWEYTLAEGQKSVSVEKNTNGSYSFYKEYSEYYGYYTTKAYVRMTRNSSLTAGAYGNSSNSYYSDLYLYKQNPIPGGKQTTISFTGNAVGTSTVTIGNVKYTINVIAEVIPDGEVLPIQLWITNNTIEAKSDSTTHTGSGWGGNPTLGYANYVNVSAQKAYDEDGISLLEAIGLTEPLTRTEWGGTRFITARDQKKSQNLVLWTGRIHNSSDSNIQTVWGTDYSNSGSAFNYVRYFGGKWAVSADGKTGWTTVTGDGSTGTYSGCTQQLAAYYMTRTAITEEVTTDVADWGKPKDGGEYDSQVSSDFVLLDFAVKYEDGTQNPKENEFPVSGKTLAYHCEDNNAAVGTNNGTKYRMLNNFRAVNTTEYEVYKVTVTMTSGSAGTQLTANSAKNGYTYDSTTEQIVWAIDEAARDASGLEEYTSISGSRRISGCKIGGNPDVRGVEVYNKHGVLITYYIRAKVMEDSLIVNYFVDGAAEPFYHYNINVDTNKDESTFKLGIALDTTTATSWKGKLVKGDVVNIKNQRQWVSANLGDMPEIGAQYRYSNYKCVRVVRESDKVVNLYYTFEAKASFVVDFGLPLIITPSDLNAELGTIANITGAIVSDTSYATVKTDGKNIIYTLKKPLDSVDTFTIQYVGKNLTTEKEGDATYDIKIYPATNVYYEENFISEIAGKKAWTLAGETVTNVYQATEKAYAELPEGNTSGINDDKLYVYGYDDNVASSLANTTGYSMGSAYHAQVTYSSDKEAAYTGDGLTFTFTGTGFDLISECSNKTGALVVRVVGAKTGYSKTYYIDTYFRGDTQNIIGEGSMVYQVPVLRSLNLDYDTYKVTVYGALLKKSGVVTPPVYATNAVSAYSMDYTTDAMRELLDACGMSDVFAEDVEIIYMDENSVLNGGTGVFGEEVVQAVFNNYAVNAVNEGTTTVTADVYVDAFRVYNPLETESAVYKNDKEDGVTYMSAYDFIADRTGDVQQDKTAILYVEYDAVSNVAEIARYKDKGPENEIYLAPGCGIAFGLSGLSDTDPKLQISAKVVSGNPTIQIGETAGKIIVPELFGTEMYYDIVSTIDTKYGKRYVVIKNTSLDSNAVLAISGLKISAGTEFATLDADLQNTILQGFYKKDNPDTVFEPKAFSVSAPETVRKNRNLTFVIATSIGDVRSVTIQMDGTNDVYELTPNNLSAVESGRATNYNYLKTFKIKEPGTYTFTIKAFDENGNSAVIHKTVTVSAK